MDLHKELTKTVEKNRIPDTIEVDGKQRPTMNSNGKPIATTEEQIKNFWKWFGDSKVVDEKGRPLVMYHGSPHKNIKEFLPQAKSGENSNKRSTELVDWYRERKNKNERIGYMDYRSGSFFSPDPEYAGNYTGENDGVMYPVYIRAVNPVYKDQKTSKTSGIDSKKTSDALIMIDGKTINEIAILDPTQVKSATSNSGTFDPNNHSMLEHDNQNTDPIATTEEQNKNFWKWFGDSKVVDKNGKPLPVYHGSFNHFNEFKNKYAKNTWEMFSDSSEYANRFASGKGGMVYKTFLNIKNPLDLTSLPPMRGDVRNKLLDVLEDAGVDVNKETLPYERDLYQIINIAGHKTDFREKVIAAGYDGIIMPDNHEGSEDNRNTIFATTYIVFSPNQIKSVWNKGKFDPNNSSMLENYQETIPDTIEVDGVKVPTTNSLGRKIANTTEGIKSFWKWFDDSELNYDSHPIVFHHSTHHNFQSFKVGSKGTNSTTFGNYETTRAAIFFSETIEDSNAYVTDKEGNVQTGAKTIPVYLKSSNSLNLTKGVPETIAEKLKNAGMSENFIYNHLGKWSNFDGEEGDNFVKIVKKAGYDSIIFNDENPNTGDGFVTVAVFSPNQIKSVWNKGKFDPNNPKISEDDLSAWHGTGNQTPYDKFDYNKVGGVGGEGAQAYGWGLYFATQKEVANHYRNTLSTPISVIDLSVNLIPFYRKGNVIDYSPKTSNVIEHAKSIFQEIILSKQKQITDLFQSGGEAAVRDFIRQKMNDFLKEIKDEEYPPEAIKWFEKEIKKANNDKNFKINIEINKGKLYNVDIPEDNEYLFWDKKLNEQTPLVIEGIKKVVFNRAMSDVKKDDHPAIIQQNEKIANQRVDSFFKNNKNSTGETIYKTFSQLFGSDKAASNALREAGIPGIRYLDGGSRANGEGTCNYVIFDDSRIKILTHESTEDRAPETAEDFDLMMDLENKEKEAKAAGNMKLAFQYHRQIQKINGDNLRSKKQKHLEKNPNFAVFVNKEKTMMDIIHKDPKNKEKYRITHFQSCNKGKPWGHSENHTKDKALEELPIYYEPISTQDAKELMASWGSILENFSLDDEDEEEYNFPNGFIDKDGNAIKISSMHDTWCQHLGYKGYTDYVVKTGNIRWSECTNSIVIGQPPTKEQIEIIKKLANASPPVKMGEPLEVEIWNKNGFVDLISTRPNSDIWLSKVLSAVKKKKALTENYSEKLDFFAKQDQKERNEYSKKLSSGKNWKEVAKEYAKEKGRSSDDLFGDKPRLNKFWSMKNLPFDSFSKKDWFNYWLLAQHSDNNLAFQKQALEQIKKYLGPNHEHTKYLADRISMSETGKQEFGTQKVLEKLFDSEESAKTFILERGILNATTKPTDGRWKISVSLDPLTSDKIRVIPISFDDATEIGNKLNKKVSKLSKPYWLDAQWIRTKPDQADENVKNELKTSKRMLVIVLNNNNEIIHGKNLFNAAISLGLKKIPVQNITFQNQIKESINDIDHWSSYAKDKTFATERSAREWLKIHSKDENLSNHFPLHKILDRWKIGPKKLIKAKLFSENDISVTKSSFDDVAKSGLLSPGDIKKVERPTWIPIDQIKRSEEKSQKDKIYKIAHHISGKKILKAIWLDKDNSIIDGHHRYEACKVLGFKKIPVQYVHLR